MFDIFFIGHMQCNLIVGIRLNAQVMH